MRARGGGGFAAGVTCRLAAQFPADMLSVETVGTTLQFTVGEKEVCARLPPP